MCAKYASENTVEFNMNVAWLMKISNEMDKYIYARHYELFDAMFTSLDCLQIFSQPKLNDNSDSKLKELCDKIEKDLEWLRVNKDRCYVRDSETGKINKVNHDNKNMIIKKFRDCFLLILTKLDEMGILTKLKYDPGKAMGNFNA